MGKVFSLKSYNCNFNFTKYVSHDNGSNYDLS